MFLATVPRWVSDATALSAFAITLITLGGIIFRFFFTPHFERIIAKETEELKVIIDEMHILVHQELKHNGGSSIKDAIAELKRDVAILKDRDEREKS